MKTRLYTKFLFATLLIVVANAAPAAEAPGAHWYAEQGRDAQRDIQRDLQRELRRNLKPITPARPEVEQALPPESVDIEQPAQKISAA